MAAEFRNALLLSVTEHLPLYCAERQVIGVDHGYAGAMLVARWKFPEPLVEAIRNHHREDAPDSPILDCLRVADQLCRGVEMEDEPLVCTHHEPTRSDDQLERVFAEALEQHPGMDGDLEIVLSYEGMEINL
jgi:hypothetical protein